MTPEEIKEIFLGLLESLPATVDNIHFHLHLESGEADPGELPDPEEPVEEPTTMKMIVLDPDGNDRERLFYIEGYNAAGAPIVLPANYENGNLAFILPGAVVHAFLTEGVDGVITADGGGKYYMIATGTTSSNAYPDASGYLLPVDVLRIED